MRKGEYFEAILKSKNTVFSKQEIALLWNDNRIDRVSDRLNYLTKKNKLIRVRRGIYAKDENYNKLELAGKIYIPSYVSFETVLLQAGLIFQYQTAISVASYLTREINISGQIYRYKKIKDTVLINVKGIEMVENISIATKERAFLDTLYSYKNYYFDNLKGLDWDKVFDLLPIYKNERLTKEVIKNFKEKGTHKE